MVRDLDRQLEKRLVRLVKNAQTGQGEFVPVNDREGVIRLAGRKHHFDLAADYGVDPAVVRALDVTTQLAFAAGLEALRDAGIPLVRTWRTTTTGKSVPTGWALPEAMRDGTGIVFASAFPGYDQLVAKDQVAEEKFVADGFGLKRQPVMYNDFVVVGPKNDPAGAKRKDIVAALQKLAAGKSEFISRGDKSGTHAAELRYWKAAGVDTPAGKVAGYKECGCGMGPALNIASSSNAYALTDRGTWLSFKNRGDLAVLVEGDTRLFNQYGVMVVNPGRHPHVKKDLAQAFADWVVSPEGQSAIAAYKIGGEQLFFPNAGR